MNAGRLDLIDELYTAALAPAARRWITPFRAAFPDVRMRIIDLIAEADQVVARFTCSATPRHLARSPAAGVSDRADIITSGTKKSSSAMVDIRSWRG